MEPPIVSHRVLIVEDNGFLAYELETALRAADFGEITAAPSYQAALKSIETSAFPFCVLDLDLGAGPNDPFGAGGEGRRLLSVLATKGVATVVYSGNLTGGTSLRDLHPGVRTIDKLEPCELVVETLREMAVQRA